MSNVFFVFFSIRRVLAVTPKSRAPCDAAASPLFAPIVEKGRDSSVREKIPLRQSQMCFASAGGVNLNDESSNGALISGDLNVILFTFPIAS